MNSNSVLLISASLVITISVILVEGKGFGPKWDLEYIKECKEEYNITNYRFTVADLYSIGIPTTRNEGCILDCYYFKMGQIKKRISPDFVEHAFVGHPPKSKTDLTSKSGTYVRKVTEAEANCASFLSWNHIEECNLIFQHRYCVSKVLNGTKLPPKLE